APFLWGKLGEEHRERPDRAHHVDLVAKSVHVLELLVEVVPFRPAREHVVGVLLPQKGITTLAVDLGARIGRAPQEPLLHRAWPPVEVGDDDSHGPLISFSAIAARPEYCAIVGSAGWPVKPATHREPSIR